MISPVVYLRPRPPFLRLATRLLSAVWPWRPRAVDRLYAIGQRRPPRPWPFYVFCGGPKGYELDAPAPLHILARLLLWPFALVDWAVMLPLDLWRWSKVAWAVPDCYPPWPPLP